MSLPQFSLLFRQRGKIDQVIDLDRRHIGRLGAQTELQRSLESAPFPFQEITPLRRRPLPAMVGPMDEIAKKPRAPRGRPACAHVEGIWMRAIQEKQQRPPFPLGLELPSHFVSNISPEA